MALISKINVPHLAHVIKTRLLIYRWRRVGQRPWIKLHVCTQEYNVPYVFYVIKRFHLFHQVYHIRVGQVLDVAYLSTIVSTEYTFEIKLGMNNDKLKAVAMVYLLRVEAGE
jgi:hypothetical protein